ncbi:MAG TPA: calcium/sodium antiporter [Cytophagaceae bacterium]
MSFYSLILFIGGLILIILGAELLLRGASSIAAMLGVKPIIIGLTVVSVGTSMPELAVGITAVAEGQSSLMVGNIAGTNILNILFILGLSAAIRPLPLQLMSIRLDVPIMIASALTLILISLNGTISRLEGGILVLAFIVYTIVLVRMSKNESAEIKEEYAEEFDAKVLVKKITPGAWIVNSLLLITGIALTILGADLLVDGAASIAQSMGVSEAVIGLTIVAIGTSAPELATTIVATIKNDRDVAVGNLIGSSISNILFILGLTCAVAPNEVNVGEDILWIDLPLAAGVAIACYPVFRSDRMVSRREGTTFVVLYLIYLSSLLWLRA